MGTIILVLWTIFLLSVLLAPISETEIPSPFGFTHFDKVAHFGLFFVTGIVSILGTKFISRFRTRVLFGIVFGLFIALSTELVQAYVPSRNADFYDLIVDVTGLSVAILLYSILYNQAKLRTFFRL